MGPDWLNLDPADNVVGESKDQEAAGLVPADASRTEIKNGFIGELADGRPVGTFDVVCINFQLRFGIDDRVFRKQQRFVGLFGIRFLGVLMDEDFAVENSLGFAVQNPLVQLMAGAMRPGVVDARVIIDQLFAGAHEQAVERTFATFIV